MSTASRHQVCTAQGRSLGGETPATTASGLGLLCSGRAAFAHEKRRVAQAGVTHQPTAPQSLRKLATKQVTEPQSTVLI